MKRTMLLASVILVFLLVTTRPSSAQMTKLPGTVPPNLGDIQGPSPAPPNMVLRMQLYFKFRNKELVDSILEGQSDPNSEYYGRSLSTKETDALFSPTKEDIDAVSTWLTSQGFELGALSEHAPVSLDFSGTADQVQRAFHISIIVSSDGRNRANTEDPLIPTQFQDIIQSIFGLSNLGGYSSGTLFNVPNKGPTLAFAPADLYEFYSISPLHKAGFKGAGGCIALVETSDFLDAAVTEFDGQFGISSVTVPRSVPAGQVNPGITSDEVEALIDVEWAHAVAPDAGLTVYLGNNTVDPLLSFPNAISLAATENTCNAIAVSFNVCQASANFFSQLDSSLALANMHSQSVFIQTGDFGAAGPGNVDPVTHRCLAGTVRNINEMAASPNVTAVGGSQFTPNYSPSTNVQVGFSAEATWKELSVGASGGGPSTHYSRPTYQVGPGVPTDGVRHVPDVSMIAGTNAPGIFIGNDVAGQGSIDCCFGGTSLSAPLWAAVAQLAVQKGGARLGNLNSRLYVLGGLGVTGGLRDVKTANNDFNGVTGFTATLAYDQATGWGTPDITTFVNAFISGRALVGTGTTSAGATITSAEIFNPPSGTFVSGGTFVDNRKTFDASSLPDGTTLIFGGVVGGTAVKTAGIYNPTAGTFTLLTAQMPQKREVDLHATLLFTGKVFISGRDDVGQWVTTALYDPVAKTFSSGPNQNPPPGTTEAELYTQTLLADGRVLIEGGTAVSQIYNPITNTFSKTAGSPAVANRYAASSVLLPDGRVLIAGGLINLLNPTATAEVFNPATGSYTQVGSMTEARSIGTPLILLNTGKALVLGTDRTADVFAPSSNSFSATGMMQVARIGPGIARPNTGKIVVAGGSASNGTALNSAEIYDPAAGTFTATGNLATARSGPFAFAVK